MFFIGYWSNFYNIIAQSQVESLCPAWYYFINKDKTHINTCTIQNIFVITSFCLLPCTCLYVSSENESSVLNNICNFGWTIKPLKAQSAKNEAQKLAAERLPKASDPRADCCSR